MTPNPQFIPDVLDFFVRHFGLRYEFADFTGEDIMLSMKTPPRFDYAVLAALEQYKDAIKRRINCEQQKRMQIFVGGPYNGERHRRFYGHGALAVRVERAKWAAYWIGTEDCRAWFIGFATSEKKARKLAYQKVQKP